MCVGVVLVEDWGVKGKIGRGRAMGGKIGVLG